ncbi:type I secretion system permease/ATPase [Vibrio sp. 10N.261.54.A5]|uniref:type I secretion system permease/ATPase n=1 Tax=Vibrio sp. 10N.261.54.A5 TaxID=3229686 RepID=UPI0035528046
MDAKPWAGINPINLRSLLPMMVVSGAISVLMLVVPLFSLQVFDRVLSSQSLDTLLFLAFIAVFLLTAQAFLDASRAKYAQKKAIKFEFIASQQLFEQTSFSSKSKEKHLFNDISEVKSLLSSPAYFVMFDLPFTPLFLIIMFAIHPYIGLVGVGAVVFILMTTLLSHWVKSKHFKTTYLSQLATQRKNDECFQKHATIFSQHQQQGLSQTYQEILAEKSWSRSHLDQATCSLSAFSRYIRMVLQLIIMAVGASLVIQNAMSAGGMIAGSILMARALQPIEMLSSGIQAWKTGLDANKRLAKEFASHTKHTERTELETIKGDLVIDNVTWFASEKLNKPTLNGLKLRLESGNRVALIGPSGSGKSSICKMITNGISPSKGGISIDGLNVELWNLNQFKHTVGYVPQHIDFLHGTVKQNIARFDSNVTDSQIVRSAIQAGVHDAVVALPNGYETIIGSFGHQLSGGQAQKLAIARALVFSPKLLVLDEPDSHLDKEGEEFLVSLLQLAKEKSISVVMVTHNPSLLRHVDWVVELKNGQITQAGEASKVVRSLFNVASPEVSNG